MMLSYGLSYVVWLYLNGGPFIELVTKEVQDGNCVLGNLIPFSDTATI